MNLLAILNRVLKCQCYPLKLQNQLSLDLRPCSLQMHPISIYTVSNLLITRNPLPVNVGSTVIQKKFLICNLKHSLTCLLGTGLFIKPKLYIEKLQMHDSGLELIVTNMTTSSEAPLLIQFPRH